MPLVKEIEADAHSRIAIWHIAETIPQLKWELQWGQEDIKAFSLINDETRALHWLASRVLLRRMLHTEKFIDLRVDEYGKPHLGNVNKYMSITHSGNLVAVMLSDYNCGIDIQEIQKRVEKISHKFISDDEWQDLDEPYLLEKMHVFWCAKEALYKLYGRRKLDFRQHLHIYPFDYHPPGKVMGEIRKDGYFRSFDNIHYLEIEKFILVYVNENIRNAIIG